MSLSVSSFFHSRCHHWGFVHHYRQATMDLSTSITQGLTPRILICLGAVMGPTAHLLFFIRGEWHVHAPTLFCSHFTGFALIILFFPQAFYLFSSYCISLFGSIVLYRLVFHRLTRAGFDGPKLARVSKLWHVWHSRDSRNHLFLHNLHSQYGDFIRTGTAGLLDSPKFSTDLLQAQARSPSSIPKYMRPSMGLIAHA